VKAVVRVALATAILTVMLAPGSARAQTPQVPRAKAPPVGVHLAYQDPWVKLGSEFTMLLGIDDTALVARPSAALLIQIHQSMISRSSFDDVIANGDAGGGLNTLTLPVASLPRLGGNLAVTIGLAGSGVRKHGVYPVEVSLTNTNTGIPTSSFITWLVVVDNAAKPIAEPLMVSQIWPLVADPARLPDGTIDPAIAAEMQPGGRLDRIATLLGKSTRFPLSLTIGPETVEAWAQLAEKDRRFARGLSRVRAAARRSTTELLPTSYVPVDIPALEAAGFGDKLPELVVKGGDTLHDVLGAAPFDGPQTSFVDPVDDDAVDRLRTMVVTRVAVRDAALQPVPHPFTPAQAFTLATPGGVSRGLATAPFVERLLEGPEPSALKAQRVVAALAEIAYETPAIPRGIVLAEPASWRPDLATLTTLVDALRGFPLVRPVTLDDLFARISTERVNGVDVARRLAQGTPPPTPLTLSEYIETRQELDAYAAVAGPTDPVIVNGEQALLYALSTAITPDRARAELARIDTAVTAFTNAVTVDAKRVTLTSRRAKVPITFENKLPHSVRVKVHLDSPKLLFPLGPTPVIELPPGRTTLRDPFVVEARTSGTFPMTIVLTSVDDQLRFGQEARVTVRSAVFGGFALALTVGALVFLAGWWANHYRRARRRAVPAVT
jgi:hypothetical protein